MRRKSDARGEDQKGREALAYSARFNRAFAERETGFEPATSTLARLHSTTELLPQTDVHQDFADGVPAYSTLGRARCRALHLLVLGT